MYCFKCGSWLRDGALFCRNCGTLRRNITHDPNGSLDSIIKYYFSKEMAYQTVVHVLVDCHDVQISLRTLKCKLKTMQLTKSRNITDQAVAQIIKRELRGSSTGHGYRFMWYKLKTAFGIQLRRSTVMKILWEEDPAGTLLRESRYIKRRVYTCDGPSNTWHANGNDKLKPYGFPIHGCVGRFSRKVLRLKVKRNNNNPVVPTSYFLETESKWNLVPDTLRTDCGNENCQMAGMQCKSANNTNTHRYWSPISKQRIENFWSHFKRIYLSWAIDFFKDLVATGSLILGKIVQMECLWFLFSPLIQCKLDRLTKE